MPLRQRQEIQKLLRTLANRSRACESAENRILTNAATNHPKKNKPCDGFAFC
jgi:hypothetical protein